MAGANDGLADDEDSLAAAGFEDIAVADRGGFSFAPALLRFGFDEC